MSFWQSGLIRNLEDGKLPSMEVKTTFDTSGALNLALALFVGGALIFLAWYALKRA